METNQLNAQSDEIEIDLQGLFYALWRKLWIIVAIAVVCAGATGVYTKTMVTPQYQSSSMLFILTTTTTISLADIQMGSQLTKDYSILIKSRPVLEEVIDSLNLELTYEQLLKKVSLGSPTDTRIITITVLDPDPQMAKKITDEIADVSVTHIADIMKTDEPSIVEKGNVPEQKTSPNTMKNSAVAGLVGMLLSALVICVLFVMDDTVKSADDIEKYLGLTTLASIPKMNKDKISKRKFRKIFSYKH